MLPSSSGQDWSDRTSGVQRVVTPAPRVIRWSSPAPVIIQSSSLAPVRASPSPSYLSPTARSIPASPLPFSVVTTPAPLAYSPSSTVTTVAPSEVSTMLARVTPMSPVFGSPVTPMYHTQFRDLASLGSSGPTGPPGLQLFKTLAPSSSITGSSGVNSNIITGQTGASGVKVPHSNSHYMEQNPFLVSPQPPASVTAATAAAVKRNIVTSLYNYNPTLRSEHAATIAVSLRDPCSSFCNKMLL